MKNDTAETAHIVALDKLNAITAHAHEISDHVLIEQAVALQNSLHNSRLAALVVGGIETVILLLPLLTNIESDTFCLNTFKLLGVFFIWACVRDYQNAVEIIESKTL